MGSENELALVGAYVELQRLRGEPDPGGRPRLLVGDGPGRLALTTRLFAEAGSGQRWMADRAAMALGLKRRGIAAVWKHYVGPQILPADQVERERFLDDCRVRQQDVADAVNQMPGRHAEQHRRPLRLRWNPVIDLLVAHGIDLIEDGLIAPPFRLEFAPEVLSEFDAPSPA